MGKNVLITGASRGIGKAAAQVFAQAGYNIAACCRTDRDALERSLLTLHRKYGVCVMSRQTDVGDPSQAADLVRSAEDALGQIDILVNNAGISSVGLITDLSADGWDRIIRTNLSSVFYMSRAVLPAMIRRKNGVIVNVSSVFGIHGASCEAAYSAAKGGVNAFTESLAKELAPSGIRVNAVAFGAVDTKMNDNLSPAEKAALTEEIPAGRFASAEEAARFLLQIAESPAYLNGQVIAFDGAWF